MIGKVAEFLKNMLPTLKWLAKLTSTPVDDQLVEILEIALANNGANIPRIRAAISERGIAA